jgi:hypothetical protein
MEKNIPVSYEIENSIQIPKDHKEIIKNIFHNVYYEDIWVCINELNEDININYEENNSRRIAKLTILNRSMLEYDKSFFNDSINDDVKDYRPYFFSFIIYMDPKYDNDIYDKLKKMGSQWFIASLSEKNSYWQEYRGEIESSASPVIYRKHNIYISDLTLSAKILNEINNTYRTVTPSSDKNVKKDLCLLLKKVRFASSNVYKVGNGNLINIIGKKGAENFNVLYDVGYHSKQHPDDKRYIYGSAVRYFRKNVIPNAVFLSHWDDDHIMGCVYAQDALFECPWIAPEIEKIRAINAKRLAAYLTKKRKLTIVKRNTIARKISEISYLNSKISFYLGENKKKGTITKENCGGLVIEIRNKKRKRRVENLFCGDIPYSAVETVIWNSRTTGYDNLVVPHHGSFMNYSVLKVKSNATAVVCGDNTDHRPDQTHIKALENSGYGYHVKVTQNSSHCFIKLLLK